MSEIEPKIILADTNALLEAYRVGCLKTICSIHRIITVEKCVEETQTGFQNRDHDETIPRQLIEEIITIQSVSDLDRAKLLLKLPNGPHLDDGELHLLAHALTRNDAWLMAGADIALIRAVEKLGHIERLISLGEVARLSHIGSNQLGRIARHHQKPWLDEQRLAALMGLPRR